MELKTKLDKQKRAEKRKVSSERREKFKTETGAKFKLPDLNTSPPSPPPAAAAARARAPKPAAKKPAAKKPAAKPAAQRPRVS